MTKIRAAAILTLFVWAASPAGSQTGASAPALAPFDRLIQSLLEKYQVPGAALAVARSGQIVLAHGYGFADPASKAEVKPNSLFRIASLSKPFTSAAILKLVEQGKLRLDDPALPLLQLGGASDERLNRITIRQLLLHEGGWDRAKSFDPMFIPRKAANAVGAKSPASCETVIRYMLTQPLQFDPGTQSQYSNFGYCVLGRVIERVTGQSYEEYVRSAILGPIGITRMRIGHTSPDERAEGEVQYADFAGAPKVRSVLDRRGGGGLIARPDGGFYLEAMDSHGGWIASAPDLVRFLMHMDGSQSPAVLQPATVARMVARPRTTTERDTWYGFGWQVRKVGSDANWWHTGSLDGTTSLMVRTSQGMHWAVLFNGSPKNQGKLFEEVDAGLWEAAGAVKRWPKE